MAGRSAPERPPEDGFIEPVRLSAAPVGTARSVVSELILELTEKFTEADAPVLRAALNRHLRVREPVRQYRFSIDPPSVIQLLGAVAAWQVLVKPAAEFTKSFFGALGKRAADAAWDGAVEWKRNKDLRPLADVATALVAAADRVGGKVTISVGLDIPDDHFGTVISTESRDALEVARVLSAFVVRAEKISDAVRAEIERGYGPVGPFFMELEQDGSVTIRWHAACDSKTHERHIP